MSTQNDLEFERIDRADVVFAHLDQFADRMFSQRACWLDFLTSFVSGEIVIAALKCGEETVGYFTGLLIRRMGIKILASPIHGWTTPYMGFNLEPEISRLDALEALERFAFRELGCLHLEVRDRYITLEEGLARGFSHKEHPGYLSDLTQSEEDLWAGMASSCRRAIRKAEKNAVTIVEGAPAGFAQQYHKHLKFVFAKQGLAPSYGVERVQALIDHCYDDGNLLLLRAMAPDGACIATGIYPRFNGYSFFWGNGSHPDYLHLRPNEALHWHAMRHAKAQGGRLHDWGGGGDYKAKYGGAPIEVSHLWKSRHGFIRMARDSAERLYYFPRKLMRRRYDAKVAKQREGATG